MVPTFAWFLLPLLLEPVVDQLAVQRPAVDSEDLGRLAPVPLTGLENAKNVLLLELVEGRQLGLLLVGGGLGDLPRAQAAPLSADQAQMIEPLTDREFEVLTLLAQQLSNKEIAVQLVISTGTVTQHTHNIYQKLNVTSRWQAVTEATRLGILTSES